MHSHLDENHTCRLYPPRNSCALRGSDSDDTSLGYTGRILSSQTHEVIDEALRVLAGLRPRKPSVTEEDTGEFEAQTSYDDLRRWRNADCQEASPDIGHQEPYCQGAS